MLLQRPPAPRPHTTQPQVTQPQVTQPQTASWQGKAIEFGPRSLLSRTLHNAERALEDLGIRLRISSLEDLLNINAENSGSWLSLFPVYDPWHWPGDGAKTYCIVGIDAAGKPVTTVAARFYHWTDTTMTEEAESLRLFYGDVSRSSRPGESCHVSAEAMKRIHGKVALIGGFWIHPDWRGGTDIPLLMGYVSQAYSIAKWDVDYCTYLMVDRVYSRGLAEKCGWRNVDWAVEMRNCCLGEQVRIAFIWQTRDEIVDHVAPISMPARAQIDASIVPHDAEQRWRA
jgi:hypothetical protein